MATQLIHRYQPVGSARELFKTKAPEVLLSGPAGTGKSRACLEKMHAMALANPGLRGLIVRKTAVSLGSTALVTFREHVAREALESGEVRFYGGSRQQAAAYVYGNGSEINVGGMDKASRIMSSEYDCAYVQEAVELTEEDWEAISTRLRNGRVSFQQLMADTNPSSPTHWLKQRCDTGRTQIIYCSHKDNPVYWDGTGWTATGQSYLARLANLTGVRRDRLLSGLWVAAEGLVYDEFDPAVHLWQPLDQPPKDWPRYWAVDFGFNNPFVCQFWTADPDGRLFLYRERYHTRSTVEENADAILAMMHGKSVEPRPQFIVTDHDMSGRQVLERKLGMTTVAAKKDVLEGIDAVKARLKIRGDGRPGLYVCRDALRDRDLELSDARKPCCTQDEMVEYVWDQRTGKEQPLKMNDHGMDAMRYLVAQLDLRPKFSYRRL